MKVELFDLYKENKEFKEYVDKYAKAHNKLFPEDTFKEDAFEHAIVINYAAYLKGRENK